MCRIRRRRETKRSSPLSLLCSLSRCHLAFTLRDSYMSISTSSITFSTPRCCSLLLLTRQSIFSFLTHFPVLTCPDEALNEKIRQEESFVSPRFNLTNTQIRMLVKLLLYLSYLLFHPMFVSVYYWHQSLSHQQLGLSLYLLDQGP